ncbi:MAG TPA: hypothetical protein VN903_30030 [Polyangia bacterium]|nr:hypothetical protein [Polyangia bacterium]
MATAVVGCKSSLQQGDGGVAPDSGSIDAASPTDTAGDGPAPMSGRRSFVVTSTLTMQSDPSNVGYVPLPATHTFTLVLDWDMRIAIFGSSAGQGVGIFEPSAAGGGGTQTATFSLGSSSVSYQTMDVTIGSSGALSGVARGRGTSLPTDTDFGFNSVVLSMSLAGVPDTQPPGFESDFFKGAPVDPLTSLTLIATEPLPPETRLALVDLRGDRIELAPPDTQLTAAFSFFPAEARMWRYDDLYRLSFDGVVDFAGNLWPPGTTTAFMTAAPPVLVPEDGFESATGATLAGAQVLSGAGAPTITGGCSLYIPSLPSQLVAGPRAAITQLALRIALDPADTVLRFAYRSVGQTNNGAGALGEPYYSLGSEGGPIASATLGADGGPTTIVSLGQGQVSVGPIMTAEFALPAGAASSGQLTLVRRVRASAGGLPAPPIPGLIIDDLRAE